MGFTGLTGLPASSKYSGRSTMTCEPEVTLSLVARLRFGPALSLTKTVDLVLAGTVRVLVASAPLSVK